MRIQHDYGDVVLDMQKTLQVEVYISISKRIKKHHNQKKTYPHLFVVRYVLTSFHQPEWRSPTKAPRTKARS